MSNIQDARQHATTVTHLDLGPDCTGKAPVGHAYEVSTLSDEIGDLSIFKNLESLSLTAFPVSPELLHSICKLSKLRSLSIWGCELRQVPEGLWQLPLESLVLNYNPIARLPRELGNLKSLARLGLCGCAKLKSIPDEVLGLQKMQTIDLDQNYALNTLPEGIEAMPLLDKASQKGLKLALKKIAKKAEKRLHRKLDALGTFFAQFEGRVCSLDFDGATHRALVFDWKYVDDELKDLLIDELGDEMSEHKAYRPCAVLAPQDASTATEIEPFLEDMQGRFSGYLMIKKKTQGLFESGNGPLDLTIEDLNVRL